MAEKNFYPEDVLVQKMQDEKKGWLYYVSHHSPELEEEYLDYCESRRLTICDESAASFLDYREKQMEDAMVQDAA